LSHPRDRKPSFRYRADNCEVSKLSAVSVITVISQVDHCFTELANSLLAQSMQNLEWIVIDNATEELSINSALDNLSALEKHCIRVFHQPPEIHDPGKFAFMHSTGTYVCFLDPGVMLDSTYIEKCVWFLDANPEFAFCNSFKASLGDDLSFSHLNLESGLDYVLNSPDGGAGTVIRRDVLEKIFQQAPSTVNRLETPELLLAVAAVGRWGFTIPEYLYWESCKPPELQTVQRSKCHNVQDLIRDRYTALLTSFPAPKHSEHQPYAPLKTDFPVDNLLCPNYDRLRIMFVIPWMVTGGTDKFNLDLVEMLVNGGHEVTLCATLKADHEWEHLFTKLTPDVFVLRRFLEPCDFPRFLSYLIKSRRINTVVISGSTIGYQFLPYLRANAPGVSFLDLSHVEEPHWQCGGHPRFGIGYQDQLDINVVSTTHLAEWMVTHGADEERTRVLYTGVDEYDEPVILSKRSEIRREFGFSDDLPVIIYGGRICQQKRPVILANILNALHGTGLAFHALVVGDGDQRTMLESLLCEYGLTTSVTMLGAVKHDRWLSLLQASDVFLLPSDYEGISIALLEAMSVGVVPVVSDVGGQREIVRDCAGYLIPHGENECDDYLNVLESLLRSRILRNQMSGQARILIAQHFSKRSTIENFERIISESQQFAVCSPRTLVSAGLARELATAAIELDRLNNTNHWLWTEMQQGSNEEFTLLYEWLSAVRKTKFGQALYTSSFVHRFLTFCLTRLKAR